MTLKQIKKVIEQIVQERTKWNGAKGPFDNWNIRKRELVLFKQQVLYDMYRMKTKKIKGKKNFYHDIYKILSKNVNFSKT